MTRTGLSRFGPTTASRLPALRLADGLAPPELKNLAKPLPRGKEHMMDNIRLSIIAIPIALGLTGCANPPPPELILNTAEWVRYLCIFQPTADQVVEIITENPTVTDVRAIAKLICAEFAP